MEEGISGPTQHATPRQQRSCRRRGRGPCVGVCWVGVRLGVSSWGGVQVKQVGEPSSHAESEEADAADAAPYFHHKNIRRDHESPGTVLYSRRGGREGAAGHGLGASGIFGGFCLSERAERRTRSMPAQQSTPRSTPLLTHPTTRIIYPPTQGARPLLCKEAGKARRPLFRPSVPPPQRKPHH